LITNLKIHTWNWYQSIVESICFTKMHNLWDFITKNIIVLKITPKNLQNLKNTLVQGVQIALVVKRLKVILNAQGLQSLCQLDCNPFTLELSSGGICSQVGGCSA
jgi:hypothetical protein